MSSEVTIQENPFFVLEVSPRDNDETVISQALQMQLLLGVNTDEARNALLSPLSRLKAEVGFLPGVETGDVKELRDCLRQAEPKAMPFEPASGLAALNGVFALTEGWPVTDSQSAAALCKCIAGLADEITVSRIMEELNEDRRASGREELVYTSEVSVCLKEHLDAVKKCLFERCKGLEVSEYHQLRMLLAETFQDKGSRFFRSAFLDDLVCDVLSERFVPEVEQQKDRIETAIREYRQYAEEFRRGMTGKKITRRVVKEWKILTKRRSEKVMEVKDALLLWNTLTQPERSLLQAKGLFSSSVTELFDELHNFTCDIFNKDRDPVLAGRLIDPLAEVFTDLPLPQREILMKNKAIIASKQPASVS